MSQRAKFLLLIALFIVPTVASFVVFYFFPPSKTSNYGTLITPVIALPEIALPSPVANTEPRTSGLRGKWLVITRDSGNCELACQKKLYAMRQARLILGREQDRVLRVVLLDDDVRPSPLLQTEFDGTIWVSAKSSAWLALLPAAPGDSSGRAAIYAADTMGNLFMRYAPEPDIKKMSNDLQRVLKASQIG
ncbi:MAG: hypothetical protein ABI905_06205 [Betaproteobacteria bacterium]